ncbi:MAG: LuxR C-terminal-related transcriptional regulator [Gemmatimonadaceae bacterium]
MFKATATVFVVDSDHTVRRNLASVVRGAGWQAETFERTDAFFARLSSATPSCVLIDLAQINLDVPDDLQRRGFDRTETPVIVIAEKADVPTTVRAMKAGAVDFLTKPVNEHALVDALRDAIARNSASQSRSAEVRALRDRASSLSQREREVMALVVAGRLNKQVGGDLGISEVTVKAHRGRMMRKMQADSLAGLVTMAAQLQRTVQQMR